MCNYTGNDFGAGYDDACCIDGMLWDLDSGDSDGLTIGGDRWCPKCETEKWLFDDDYHILHSASPGANYSGAMLFEAKLRKAFAESPKETLVAIGRAQKVEATDFKDRVAKDWKDTRERTYFAKEMLKIARSKP